MILSFFRLVRLAVLSIFMCGIYSISVNAAPYGAVVMDARDGKVLYARNGTKQLHPASLTKMMTLYIAFAEVEAGRISLEKDILISKNAASQPPSKMGLRAGSTMKFKYLLRAAAIKSANDAATAIAEAIAGTETNFARYMTQTAKALGMKSTQFKNAHGLSASGHYSTPMDMAVLGRHIVYDYPRFYNLFSRDYADTPLGRFRSSNVRFLSDYPGADGIKTGYTRAAGYNLVGTAKRGGERVIVSMFGGESSFQRNEQVGALLDFGFQKASPNVKVSNISRPKLKGAGNVQVAAVAPVPKAEPVAVKPVTVATPEPVAAKPQNKHTFGTAQAPETAITPAARVASNLITNVPTVIASEQVAHEILESVVAQGSDEERIPAPPSRPGTQVAVNASAASSTGDFSIQAGAFDNKADAETYLIDALAIGSSNLSGSSSRVISSGNVYRARFSGLSKQNAYNACSKLSSGNNKCYVLAPS